jgi:hypothetical protein
MVLVLWGLLRSMCCIVRRPTPAGPLARRVGLTAGTMIGIGLIAFSGHFGRAHPVDNYRPALPPAALSTGCWPLPAGLRFTFPFQVRTDGDTTGAEGQRRHLLMQFDLISLDEARTRVRQDFVAAGFTPRTGPSADTLRFHKPGVGPVAATLAAFDGVTADSIVQGTIALDLPSIRVQSSAPVCSQPSATKRFPVAS